MDFLGHIFSLDFVWFIFTLFGVNCEKKKKKIELDDNRSLFHMNGDVLCFFGQLRPTKMLFKHRVYRYQVVRQYKHIVIKPKT